MTIELTDAATDYLARKGYDPDNGARPLARVIQEEVKRPLGDELLFGELEHGGHVVVDAKDGALTFAFEPAAPGRCSGERAAYAGRRARRSTRSPGRVIRSARRRSRSPIQS